MAGGCCGRAVRVLPRLDPDTCNVLRQTVGGLLVPRALVEGVAPGTAVGDARSVDIDVQAPAAGSCPETWTVGARLTPATGFAVMPAGEVNLLPAPGTWADLPGTDVTLAEAGVYNLDGTFRGHVSATPPAHVYLMGRLWDVTAGAVVPGAQTWVAQINQQVAAPGYAIDATGDVHVPYAVNGPTTVRMQSAFTQAVGAATQARVISLANGWTRLRATKVRD
ncbi:hypothetical protein [Streptomyces sp. DH8]|uniref:hypothetical protein n=1 Tax=Streptomyces sp. DH8 TaxID=2857008 RepID=UPI001E4DF11D|nr:hypothetical protein [Streptomyces sp. DH8]